MERRKFISALSLAGITTAIVPEKLLAAQKLETAPDAQGNEREYWSRLLYKIANPVLTNLANGTLKKNMPLEKAPTFGSREVKVAYLEIVGRTIAGIAPWLATPDDDTPEGLLRKDLRTKMLQGLTACFAPNSPDALTFDVEFQPIVDAAFLCQGLLRAPKALWEPLDKITKERIVKALKSLRNRKPFNNNWLLFGSLTEAFLLSVGETPDQERLQVGPKMLDEWYKGDGWYGDGPHLAFDYYNSFVIHPMMVDTVAILVDKGILSKETYDKVLKRMQRYAAELERMISPEGTYPPIGRSIVYRTAAFHALSQIALLKKLPADINYAQVRCALTKVKQNMYEASGTFDNNDWLQLGFVGHYPDIAENYISTGSLYMATLSFLPLGLPATDEFWTGPAADWTAKRAWAGKGFTQDHSVQ